MKDAAKCMADGFCARFFFVLANEAFCVSLRGRVRLNLLSIIYVTHKMCHRFYIFCAAASRKLAGRLLIRVTSNGVFIKHPSDPNRRIS